MMAKLETTMLCVLMLSTVALAGDSEPHHIQVDDSVKLWDYTTIDSGWWPEGSFAQIRFLVDVDGETQIKMEGDSSLSWLDGELSLRIDGEPGSGVIDLDVDLTFSMAVKLDFWAGLVHVDWEETVRTESVSFSDRVTFDPWNFSASELVSTEAPSDEIEVFRLRYDVIPALVHFDVVSHLQPTLNASYMTPRIETEFGVFSAEHDVITMAAEPDQEALWINAIVHQRWVSHLNLEMNSGLEICVEVVGCFDELAITTPFDELVETVDRVFETATYTHPLPVFGTALSTIDFGEVVIDGSGVHELSITNPGEMILMATATIEGGSAFRVFPGSVTAPAGTSDGLLIMFDPTDTGAQAAELVFETTDPARAEIRLSLIGQGQADETSSDTGDPDTGVSDDHEPDVIDTGTSPDTGAPTSSDATDESVEADAKGCNCTSAHSVPGPLMWLLSLGWIARQRRATPPDPFSP